MDAFCDISAPLNIKPLFLNRYDDLAANCRTVLLLTGCAAICKHNPVTVYSRFGVLNVIKHVCPFLFATERRVIEFYPNFKYSTALAT